MTVLFALSTLSRDAKTAEEALRRLLRRTTSVTWFLLTFDSYTVELQLSGIIGKASHPDMQKIRIIGFFFENRLHRQFAVRLLLFTVCTCV